MKDYNVDEFSNRLLEFTVRIVKLVNAMPMDLTGRTLGSQILRSGTSVAANYEEATAAESRADFLHKLTIAFKEMRETRYWLRLIVRAEIISSDEGTQLLEESEQLCRIFAKSVLTTKENNQKIKVQSSQRAK